jgi:hypothetical protein
LRSSFAFNLVELNELFSNICQFSLGNVGLGSNDGSKYLYYSNFYKKVLFLENGNFEAEKSFHLVKIVTEAERSILNFNQKYCLKK